MFVDYVKVYVKGGDGGNGLIAFRREKYVPHGGPAGGDGGRGGNVVFEVDEGLRTLMDFRYQRHFKAPRGENGGPKNQHGKNGEDLIVPVPPGTVVRDAATNEVIADLTKKKERAVIARGGRGGRGNTRFATATNPAPQISENGEPGEEREIVVELKLLADAGLVGFPSVGKSTLLSVVSAARPKIAAYHFTTLAPNLGVVETDDSRSFVLADLPGLIEGAHEGAGLGYQFLRHIERTKVFIHVVDISGSEGRDPYEDFCKINRELHEYDSKLAERPQVVAANKIDLPGAEENLAAFKKKIGPEIKVFPISAVTKEGVRALLYEVCDLIDHAPSELSEPETKEEPVTYTLPEEEPAFSIRRDDDGVFIVEGEKIEKLMKMTNFMTDEGARRFARQLRRFGVDDALRKKGVQDGDTVRILDYEFEFFDG